MKFHRQYKSSTPSIAVIGQGFSGTWQTIYLLDKATEDMTIYEIENVEHRRGGGIAYGECDERHQVNLPPERQCGRHDNNQDYLQWLNSADRSRWPQAFRDQVGDQKFTPGCAEYPRGLFKLYSQDRLQEAKDRAAARGVNIKYVKITGEAVSVDEDGGKPLITLKSGDTIESDLWLAATGHGPASVPPFMKHLHQSDRVMLDPWDQEKAKAMGKRDPKESILYVGTGMTTYDLIIRDDTQGHTGKKVMMSRHGDTHFTYPYGHTFKPAVDVPIPEAFSRATNKDELLNGKSGDYEGVLAVYQELIKPVSEGGKGYESEQVLFAWEKQIPTLLARLNDADLRALFRQKTQANTQRIGIAPKVGEAMQLAKQNGLETWSGDIHRMEEKPDGIYVALTRHDVEPAVQETIRFDRVYSGLGMSADFNSISETNPLWRDIIHEKQMTEPHRFGGVQTEAGGKLPGAHFGYAVGMPTCGSRVEKGFTPTVSGAVVTIRGDFEATAERMLSQLKEIKVHRKSAVHPDEAVRDTQGQALTL